MSRRITDPEDALDLLVWKRRVFELYEDIRGQPNATDAWAMWRKTRDEMFRSFEQSPIPREKRDLFGGCVYFDYDPRYRVEAATTKAAPEMYEIPTSGNITMRFSRIGRASFELLGHDLQLELYWLDAYAGGLFVPFRDATSGRSTYGAGRYLLDTVKGADLGHVGDRLILDFNFAYNPSCAYDPQWVCPLAPPPNRLDLAIEAGERTPAPFDE